MADQTMYSNIETIAWAGKSDPGIWKLITGCRIIHRNGEEFTFIKVDDNRYLKLLSNQKASTHSYLLENIEQYFTELILPEDNLDLLNIMTQLKKEKEREINNEQERKRREKYFNKLREKYGVQEHKHPQLLQWVDNILERLDNGNRLDKIEEKKLFENKFYIFLAKYHEELIKQGKENQWSIAKAGSYWRYANKPEHTLRITDIVIPNNNKLNAAIQTTRGAAFLDLGNYTKAMECAFIATEYDNSGCCPYNLLGAIHIELAELDEGRKYFDIAKDKKGYNPDGQACVIREFLKRARSRKGIAREREKYIVEYFKDYLKVQRIKSPGYSEMPF